MHGMQCTLFHTSPQFVHVLFLSIFYFLCVSAFFALVFPSNTIFNSIIIWNYEVQGTFHLFVTNATQKNIHSCIHKHTINRITVPYMSNEQRILKGEPFYLIIVLLSISIRNRSSQAFFTNNYSYYNSAINGITSVPKFEPNDCNNSVLGDTIWFFFSFSFRKAMCTRLISK